MTSYKDIIAHEVSRHAVYKGLSRCFQYPDKEMKKRLRGLEYHCQALQSGARSAVRLMMNGLHGRKDLERMRLDFARLFIGPYRLLAPPYGSIYLESRRSIMGRSTSDVIRFYNQAGLEIAPAYKEAPDHISVELEFMYYLIFKEIRMLKRQDFDCVEAFIVDQRDFLQDHLGPWIPAFLQIVKAEAHTDFYRHLADATECFIAEDRETLLNLELAHHAPNVMQPKPDRAKTQGRPVAENEMRPSEFG